MTFDAPVSILAKIWLIKIYQTTCPIAKVSFYTLIFIWLDFLLYLLYFIDLTREIIVLP